MKNDTLQVQIGNYTLSNKNPPFIVAELSGNHNGSLERALKIIDAAKYAGAHAIKLQTYTADTMTLDIKNGDFYISAEDSLWKGRSLYELYTEAHTPWKWHPIIFEHCKKIGLEVFSSPFDETAVDFLETLNSPCYKIASLEIVNFALLEKVAKTKKPVIVSTGAATLEEIQEAVDLLRKHESHDIILLRCASAYPAKPEDLNLKSLEDLQKRFHTLVGLSDHTLGIGASIASVALGACLIEKHFTLSRKEGGVDSAFSLEPEELKALVIESNKAFYSLGDVVYGPTAAEKNELLNRRSLYFAKDLDAGSLITESDIRAVRPGHGLPPKHLKTLIGKQVAHSVKRGTPVTWNIFTN